MPPKSLSLLGIPLDFNSSYLRGTAQAPSHIRQALACDASNRWSEAGVHVAPELLRDHGDLEFASPDSAFDAITNAASRLAADSRPLFLGGDHSITFPLVRGVNPTHSPLTIVHFDAHPDLYPEYEGNRFSHACPFARILEKKLASRLIQIGIRTLNSIQRQQAEHFGVEILKIGPVNWDALRITGPVYVSLDMDVLDPAFAPGVSHREPGGLSVREVISCLHAIPAPVIATDLVEYNPAQDISGLTATVCAKLVKELAALLARH